MPARPGAGRPHSSTDTRTVRAYRALAREGIQPLEVLVWNMRKAFAKALEAERKIVEQGGVTISPDGEDLARTEWDYRKAAAEMAIAAAPYMHSKLASVELTGKDGGPIQTAAVERPKLTQEQWLAEHGIGNNAIVDVKVKES